MEHERFEDLDEAVAAMGRAVDRIRTEGPLEEVRMLRTFEPGQRVAARVELSAGGWLRGREAGIDVMGDGTLVPFAGGMRRRPLEPAAGETELDAVRRELE